MNKHYLTVPYFFCLFTAPDSCCQFGSISKTDAAAYLSGSGQLSATYRDLAVGGGAL